MPILALLLGLVENSVIADHIVLALDTPEAESEYLRFKQITHELECAVRVGTAYCNAYAAGIIHSYLRVVMLLDALVDSYANGYIGTLRRQVKRCIIEVPVLIDHSQNSAAFDLFVVLVCTEDEAFRVDKSLSVLLVQLTEPALCCR